MGPIHSFAPTLSSHLGYGHPRTHGTAARSRELDEGVEREEGEVRLKALSGDGVEHPRPLFAHDAVEPFASADAVGRAIGEPSV